MERRKASRRISTIAVSGAVERTVAIEQWEVELIGEQLAALVSAAQGSSKEANRGRS